MKTKKLYFGSRGGVYYKKGNRNVYMTKSQIQNLLKGEKLSEEELLIINSIDTKNICLKNKEYFDILKLYRKLNIFPTLGLEHDEFIKKFEKNVNNVI